MISGRIDVAAMDFPVDSFKGFKNFNSWFSGCEIKFLQVVTSQSSVSSYFNYCAYIDAIVYVPSTTSFDFRSYFSLVGSYPKGSFGKFSWLSFTFDEIAPHQNSIEEWLKLIYEGLTGKDENGNSTVTDPDIAAGLVSGNDAQGQIDSFEQNITGQFNSSFTDLNLDGFQITGGTLAALSFVSGWVMSFFNASGDLKMIILLPLFIGLALLLIGRGSMAMVRVRSKNNRNKGGGS